MRHICVSVIVFLPLVGLGPAGAQEGYRVRLTNPADTEAYGPGATCVITGVVHFPAAPLGKESPYLRIRLYRPGKTDFIVVQSVAIEVTQTKGKESFAFTDTSLIMPKEAGPYILRVDCVDRGRKDPKNLLATTSLFLTVKNPKAKAEVDSPR
jgi:hypothetical protein